MNTKPRKIKIPTGRVTAELRDGWPLIYRGKPEDAQGLFDWLKSLGAGQLCKNVEMETTTI